MRPELRDKSAHPAMMIRHVATFPIVHESTPSNEEIVEIFHRPNAKIHHRPRRAAVEHVIGAVVCSKNATVLHPIECVCPSLNVFCVCVSVMAE